MTKQWYHHLTISGPKRNTTYYHQFPALVSDTVLWKKYEYSLPHPAAFATEILTCLAKATRTGNVLLQDLITSLADIPRDRGSVDEILYAIWHASGDPLTLQNTLQTIVKGTQDKPGVVKQLQLVETAKESAGSLERTLKAELQKMRDRTDYVHIMAILCKYEQGVVSFGI